MVVLTIVTQKNAETVYFDDPISGVHSMKLISCSFYNSWDTYTLESLANEIQIMFYKYQYMQLETQIDQPFGEIVIKNFGVKPLELDRDLAHLLGIGRQLKQITYISKAYFIHCDLIDKEKNLFNGKRSDLLARFDIKGKAFEKVSYL